MLVVAQPCLGAPEYTCSWILPGMLVIGERLPPTPPLAGPDNFPRRPDGVPAGP